MQQKNKKRTHIPSGDVGLDPETVMATKCQNWWKRNTEKNPQKNASKRNAYLSDGNQWLKPRYMHFIGSADHHSRNEITTYNRCFVVDDGAYLYHIHKSNETCNSITYSCNRLLLLTRWLYFANLICSEPFYPLGFNVSVVDIDAIVLTEIVRKFTMEMFVIRSFCVHFISHVYFVNLLINIIICSRVTR